MDTYSFEGIHDEVGWNWSAVDWRTCKGEVSVFRRNRRPLNSPVPGRKSAEIELTVKRCGEGKVK